MIRDSVTARSLGSSDKDCQALVEFAVIVPLLLLMMLGLVNLGLLVVAQIELTQAAWEAARAGATLADPRRGDGEIVAAARDALHLLSPDQVEIEIDPSASEWPRTEPWPMPRGHPLSVILLANYPLSLPFSPSIRLSAAATSRMEYQNP